MKLAGSVSSPGKGTIGSLMTQVRRELCIAGIKGAEQEALWLIEHAAGLSGLQQVVDRERMLSEHDLHKIRALVARRRRREPLQYILGTQEFCGLEFEVNSSVLIPRPETELLVRETVRRLTGVPHPVLIDVGTGSGCLAVTLARAIPGAKVFAIDLSVPALETAKRNARRHGVEAAITWLAGDLLAPLDGSRVDGTVKVIVSNPPYIQESEWSTLQPEVGQYEPRSALVAGPLGIEFHERLLHDAVSYLMPGGLLMMELGQGQSSAVQALVAADRYYAFVDVVQDPAGIDRVMIVQRAC